MVVVYMMALLICMILIFGDFGDGGDDFVPAVRVSRPHNQGSPGSLSPTIRR